MHRRVIKSFIFTLSLLFCASLAKAQINVGLSTHISRDTRVGLFLDVKDRVVLDGRIIDFSLLIDTSFEIFLFYKALNKPDYEVYVGVGHGTSAFEEYYGVIPAVGTNIYPFENKQFGFHLELNPIITDESLFIFRASWGVRYTFSLDEDDL